MVHLRTDGIPGVNKLQDGWTEDTQAIAVAYRGKTAEMGAKSESRGLEPLPWARVSLLCLKLTALSPPIPVPG